MKRFFEKKCAELFVAVLLLSALPMSAFAQTTSSQLTIYNAPHGGNSQFNVFDGPLGGTKHHINSVLTGPTSAHDKALLTISLINAELMRVAATLGAETATTSTINLDSTVKGFEYRYDGTGERHNYSKFSTPPTTPPKKTKATVDFHGFSSELLSGVDENGNESVFQTSFGFDGFVVDASFNFSDLTGNTIDDLLTDTFNAFLADLLPIYATNLSLDLFNNEINFEFPDADAAGFVDTYTSDTNTYASLGLVTSTVPEPSVLSLLLISAIAFGFGFPLRQNRTEGP